MENLAHWTQQSVADFVYSISSTFVAQIETKMEDDDISRSELADKLNKSSGRVSQILNNPGNLSLRVMAETASALGMKMGVIAYDDRDPTNENGPIDPDVFVKCWEHAGRPSNLFEAADAFATDSAEDYFSQPAAIEWPTGTPSWEPSESPSPSYFTNAYKCALTMGDFYSKITLNPQFSEIPGSHPTSGPQTPNDTGEAPPPFPIELIRHQQAVAP